MEILPGVHRIESDLGARFMCQYLLIGEDRTVLVDTGLAGTPSEVILPYLESVGLSAGDVDEVIVSHVDLDHCGGNRAFKDMNPSVRISCGEADRAFVESNSRTLATIYGWSEPYGFGPGEADKERILLDLGGDCPVDAGLSGGETLRLGPGKRIEILHLPGHTPGHLGLWDPETKAAIIIDAALETGIYDREGNRLIPPRIFDLPGYEKTVGTLLNLRPDHLLTAHYPPMRGEEALGFLERSLGFAEELRRVTREGVEGGTTDLWKLTRFADERLGPYPEFAFEIGAGVRSSTWPYCEGPEGAGVVAGVVTAGETMVLGVPPRPGRLRHASGLDLKVGGAESNLAIALSRLGIPAGWASALGDDEPGQLVLDRVRAEGVDTSRVERLPDRPTGLYLREKVGAETRVYYYRAGSAASALAPGALDRAYLEGADFLHLTGITPALSESCRDFVLWAAREAREVGVRVSFDVNYRSKIWGPDEARAFAEEMFPAVDVLLVGDEEARALWGRDDLDLLREFAAAGPEEVILKKGAEGSLALAGDAVFEAPSFGVEEVDSIGAGDAFAAGFLAAHLWGRGPEERLRTANAMGALSVATLGDYEGLPDRRELQAFLKGEKSLGR